MKRPLGINLLIGCILAIGSISGIVCLLLFLSLLLGPAHISDFARMIETLVIACLAYVLVMGLRGLQEWSRLLVLILTVALLVLQVADILIFQFFEQIGLASLALNLVVGVVLFIYLNQPHIVRVFQSDHLDLSFENFTNKNI